MAPVNKPGWAVLFLGLDSSSSLLWNSPPSSSDDTGPKLTVALQGPLLYIPPLGEKKDKWEPVVSSLSLVQSLSWNGAWQQVQ